MKKQIILISALCLISISVFSQIAINKDGSLPDPNAILHVKGSGNNHFFIDDVTGNVGVGTLDPTVQLEIANAGSNTYEHTIAKLALFSDGSNASAIMQFNRSHSPAMGDATSATSVTLDGDILGRMSFSGIRVNGSGGSSSGAGWVEMIQKGGPTSSGVPGQFQIITSNGLGDRNPRLVVSPDGFVGIGTTTPQTDLDIGGKLFFSTEGGGVSKGQIDFNNNSGVSDRMIIRKNAVSSTFGEINVLSDDDLRFRTNDQDRLIIKNNGYVGIGTITPYADLEVANIGDAYLRISADWDNSGGDNGTQNAYLQLTTDGGDANHDGLIWLENLAGDTRLHIDVDNFDTMVFHDGKVGIGTDLPSEKLDVEGNLEMNGNQIFNMCLENRTSDPSNPAVGQIWIRTDL